MSSGPLQGRPLLWIVQSRSHASCPWNLCISKCLNEGSQPQASLSDVFEVSLNPAKARSVLHEVRHQLLKLLFILPRCRVDVLQQLEELIQVEVFLYSVFDGI